MRMIVIDRFYSLGEAESARLELGFHGIDSFIEHENCATLVPYFMNGTKSGIELKTSEENVDAAKEILKQWQSRHDQSAGNPPFVRYLLPAITGTILGLLLIKPISIGAVIGLLIALIFITIYNHGVNRGYTAGRSEREEEP